MRVVVADHDASFLEPFEKFLRSRGCEATSTQDGLACWNALREFTPDVLAISSDLMWGGMEGVLTLMHEDAALCNLPVLLLQREPPGIRARRHPMVISTARRSVGFEELARQLRFLAILGEEEARRGSSEPNVFVPPELLSADSAIWNA